MKHSFLIILSFLFFSCSKGDKQEEVSYHKGDLTIQTDGSFESVTNALADGYMIAYPDTKIKVEVKKEDLAFLDLISDKTKIIVMSRELSINESKEYKRVTGLDAEPARFAADAVLFVVAKDSPISTISFDDIKKELTSDNKKLIFDGTNSSNLNFVAQKINKNPSELQFSIINGNANVIEQLYKYPEKIGVISLNTFSRPYSKEAELLRSKVKVLSISKDGKTIEYNQNTLRDMSYPFTRVLYFLNREGAFGIAHGFVRYSCTQLGQIIVQKEGLQQYNLYKRQVRIR
jgi:phosphate transport system substrate-binding protein